MDEVSVRELRNNGGEVLARVEGGSRLTVTRDGRPVAELRPLRRSPLPATVLFERWRRLPPIDASALRTDIDNLLDQSL